MAMNSYFDLVHQDALRAIVRSLSKRPNAQRWLDYLHVQDAIDTIAGASGLAKVAENMLNSIRVCNSYEHDLFRSQTEFDWFDMPMRFSVKRVETEGKTNEFSLLATAEEIPDGYIKVTSETLRLLCNNVTRLLIDCDEKLNGRTVRQLNKVTALEIHGVHDLRSILSTIPATRLGSVCGLRELRIIRTSSSGVCFRHNLWRVVGPTLTCLEIYSPKLKDMIAIAKFCEKLEDLSLRLVEDSCCGYALKLCISLGDKLVRLISDCFDSEEFEVIIRSCPKVLLGIILPNSCLDTLKTVSSRLIALRMGVMIDEPEVIASCERLKVLEIAGTAEKASNLLKHVSTSVSVLRLRVTLGWVQTALSQVQSVRELHLKCTRMPIIDFSQFRSRNEELQVVCIQLQGSRIPTIDEVLEVVQGFGKLEKIKHLEISRRGFKETDPDIINEMATVCLNLRMRQVYVVIFDAVVVEWL